MDSREGNEDLIHARIRQIVELEAEEISIFNLLSREEIRSVADYFDIVHHPAGAVLLREGEKVDYLGIVAAGVLEARHRPTIGDKEITIARLEVGAHLGTISFPGGRPAIASVVAEESTDLLVLSQPSFEALAEKMPAVAVKLLKGIVEVLTIRLESAIERVILFF